MNSRNLVVFFFGTFTLAGVIACTPRQRQTECRVVSGAFAAKYTLTSGTGACSMIPGEVIGLASYEQKSGPAKVAMTSGTLAGLQLQAFFEGRYDVDGVDTAVSTFDTEVPDKDGFCTASGFDNTHVHLQPMPALQIPFDPSIPGYGPDFDDGQGGILPIPGAFIDDAGTLNIPEREEVAFEYQWKNLKAYVSAQEPGTQITADVTIRSDMCEASYQATAVWPSISCANEMGMPDVSLCEVPEPVLGFALHPKTKVKCDPETLRCVLDGVPPAVSK